MKYTTTKRTKDCLHKISASNSENNRKNAKKSKRLILFLLKVKHIRKLQQRTQNHILILHQRLLVSEVSLPRLVRQGFCTPGHRENGASVDKYGHSNNQQHAKAEK